ncbi:MAG: MarR family winged helix-turn-helix transcriptional regulator [Blastomonas sp.]
MTRKLVRLGEFMPYRLSITSNAVSDLIAREYRSKFGLKIAEWRVMAVLGDVGEMTQRELVAATRMDKVAVNRATKTLEERALIVRNPNARDGRSHHLTLTGAGKALHAEIMPLAMDMESRIIGALSEAEQATLAEMLERLLRRADSIADQ